MENVHNNLRRLNVNMCSQVKKEYAHRVGNYDDCINLAVIKV